MMNLTTNDKTADITIYGDIGESFSEESVTAKKILKKLEELDVNNINLYINSNGGDVHEAIAISNSLKRHKARITAYIDGIVASAATIITSACDVVKMPKNSLFMIHNPWTVAMGDGDDFRKKAEILEKVKKTIISTYVNKTRLEEKTISELMDKESWMTSEEAKEYGFVDEIIEETNVEVVEDKILSNGLIFNMINFNKNSKKNKGSDEEMTKEELKMKFPEIYNQIMNEGAEKERERIKELEDLGVNHEIVNKAKFENLKNANEIAIELLKAKVFSNKTEENQMLNNSDIKMADTENKELENIIAKEVQKAIANNKIQNMKNEGQPINSVVKTTGNKDIDQANKILAFMGGK